MLYLAKIMLRLTDDEHGLQVEQIINELAKYDIAAERKSIYSDLEALISDGNPATLFIDHLERASMEFQFFLSSVLGKINTDFTSKDYHPVRFICSYSGDIKEQISSGLFLNELFFQLNTLSLKLNPIRGLSFKDRVLS